MEPTPLPTPEQLEPTPALPDPEARPTIPLWPDTGRALGLGRGSTYAAADRGEIPTIRIGRKLVVPTAAVRRMVELDRPSDPREVA